MGQNVTSVKKQSTKSREFKERFREREKGRENDIITVLTISRN